MKNIVTPLIARATDDLEALYALLSYKPKTKAQQDLRAAALTQLDHRADNRPEHGLLSRDEVKAKAWELFEQRRADRCRAIESRRREPSHVGDEDMMLIGAA